jgi:hypothetical protein
MTANMDQEKAADRIIANSPANQKPVTRPLCPYPQVAKYKGSGSADDAANLVQTRIAPGFLRCYFRKRSTYENPQVVDLFSGIGNNRNGTGALGCHLGGVPAGGGLQLSGFQAENADAQNESSCTQAFIQSKSGFTFCPAS